ncbi:MAG TPA: hypothetical protein VNQ90_10385 [Chthoniobacteraceae bacterium]|nr:hypothetical protein [Chthoniobacteraceae bacterium]
MADRHSSPRLTHTIKFRLGEADYDRLARQAEAHHLRVNEFSRQMVTGRSAQMAGAPALDPAVVIPLQDIGVRLRQMLGENTCPPAMRERIGGLCQSIERLIDHAIAGGPASWFR